MNEKTTYYCEELNLILDVEFKRGRFNHGWGAVCSELRSVGYSDESKEEAYRDLKEDIDVFIKIHKERGTLEQTLKNWNVNYESRS